MKLRDFLKHQQLYIRFHRHHCARTATQELLDRPYINKRTGLDFFVMCVMGFILGLLSIPYCCLIDGRLCRCWVVWVGHLVAAGWLRCSTVWVVAPSWQTKNVYLWDGSHRYPRSYLLQTHLRYPILYQVNHLFASYFPNIKRVIWWRRFRGFVVSFFLSLRIECRQDQSRVSFDCLGGVSKVPKRSWEKKRPPPYERKPNGLREALKAGYFWRVFLGTFSGDLRLVIS